MAPGVQRPMPRRRSGHTTAVTIGAERFYLTANQRDDGSLGEVFIHWGKHGTSSAGLVSTYAIALSVGLRHRVPLAELIRPGLDQYFLPNGRTDDPEIPSVWSAVDYIARRLAIDWLPYPDRAALGVYTLAERAGLREAQRSVSPPSRGSARPVRQLHQADHVRLRGHRGRPAPAARRSSPRALHGASR
jgi:ribonucleoside-diphosphate reductase alpha chain